MPSSIARLLQTGVWIFGFEVFFFFSLSLPPFLSLSLPFSLSMSPPIVTMRSCTKLLEAHWGRNSNAEMSGLLCTQHLLLKCYSFDDFSENHSTGLNRVSTIYRVYVTQVTRLLYLKPPDLFLSSVSKISAHQKIVSFLFSTIIEGSNGTVLIM